MVTAFDWTTNFRVPLQWSIVGRVVVMLAMLMASGGCGAVQGSRTGSSDNAQEFQKNFPVRLVWAAEGKDVELPCDITSPEPGDSPKLVLWFKDSIGIPLYSLDLRNVSSFKHATHAALASELGLRLYFAADGDHPKDARLQIRAVHKSDGGVYRCRVDFFNSATRNVRVNLSLVVPPDEPRIFDAQGKEISHIAGPFREGYEMFLSCQVTSGHPLPKVTWWRDGVQMNHLVDHEGLSAMVNHLSINHVSRDLYGTRLECRAQGSDLIEPVKKEVIVQVHLKPLKTKIVSPNELLTAGKAMPLQCETWGSYPPAKVTWLLDGEPIRHTDISTHNDNSDEGNVTVSTLNLKVTSVNDGAELMCRATNPWFSGVALEDKRIISVAYAPTVSVHLANEDPSRMVTRAERENVTLKCRADARPPVSLYSWFKNGMRMSGENTETLYLTQLERESAGLYACGAQNSEGETRSSTIMLKVQYAPRCKPGTEQHSVGAINMHSIPVRCEVDADPPESIRFSWTYNNTRNVSPVLNSRITSHGSISTMTYLPQTDKELITLACWASNAVGHQVIPCLIHILPAKTPEPPKSCELRNDTYLEVVCVAGFDGGLTQHFMLEVVGGNPFYPTTYTTRSSADFMDNDLSTMNDQATTAPLRRLIESIPEFKLVDLEPGREYQFLVYAQNAKGKSHPPIVINGRVLREALGTNEEDNTLTVEDPTPAETSSQAKASQSTLVVLAAVIAAGAVVVTSIIVTGIVMVCRTRRRKPPEPQEVRKRMRPLRTDVPSMYAEDDGSSEEFTRSADIRSGCGGGIGGGRIIDAGGIVGVMVGSGDARYGSASMTKGYVQYSQPSLNVFIADPDLIMNRGDIEFTTLGGPD